MKDVTEYRLWYQCLKRSNRKEWTDRVAQHFTTADGLEWEPWWQQCEHLFIDDIGPTLTVQEIDTRDEFELYWNDFRGEDAFAVWVDLTATQQDLLAAFEKMLREKQSVSRGRPKKGGSFAEFELTGHVNVKATERALAAYDLRGSMTLWQIGVKLKVNLIQIPDDGSMPNPEQKRILAVTVSRYLARVEALIKGTQRGIFPVPR